MNIPTEAVEAAGEFLPPVWTSNEVYRAQLIQALEAAAPHLMAPLVALAEQWNARGEHDMAYSKTVPDEYIAMELLTNGADMVENARHIRNAISDALGDGK
jgi:hypothetical protein